MGQRGFLSKGGFSRGVFCPGGGGLSKVGYVLVFFFKGGLCPRGVLERVFLEGGFWRGGFWKGGICPATILSNA